MTISEFSSKYPSHKKQPASSIPGYDTYEITDLDKWALASVPVNSAEYGFLDGTLVTISLKAEIDTDAVILPAMIEKCGPVSRRTREDFNSYYFWEGGPTYGYLCLSKFFSSLSFADSALLKVRDSRAITK